MAELISTEEFHRSEDLTAWRVVAGGPTAHFRTDSFADGAALTERIAAAGTADGQQPHVDLRPDGVTVRLPIFGPEDDGFASEYAAVARRISAAAADLGLSADPAVPQTAQICIDALDPTAVAPFWRALLGGYIDRDGPDDLIDPHWRLPAVTFQQMDAPRPQRNRIHLDIYLPYDQAESRAHAALAAGGRVVRDNAPHWWVLSDAEGNEACVVPVGGVAENPTPET